MADLINVNGFVHNGNSVRVMVGHVPFFGVTAVRYKPFSREVALAYALGSPEPYAIVLGEHRYDPVTIEMYLESARTLIGVIGRTLEIPVDIDVMMAPSLKSPARHDMLEQCYLTDANEIAAQTGSSDPLKMELVFQPMRVRFDTPSGKVTFTTGFQIPGVPGL
jgi:hypothetical protein